MTKRICFIGDSHVGALRLALNQSDDAALKESTDIFGSRGPSARYVKLKNNKLVPTDPEVARYFELTGGSKSIDLDNYDHICVVGCGVNLKRIKRVCQRYTTHALNLPNRQMVSQGLLDAILVRELKDTIAYLLVEMISSAVNKPIYFIGCPLFSESVLQHQPGKFFQEMMDAGVASDLIAWYDRSVQDVFGKFAHVIRQPDTTRTDVFFTKDIYSKGAMRLAGDGEERPDDDFAHMNALYGQAVLDQFITSLPEQRLAVSA